MALLILMTLRLSAASLSTAFTYQGQLNEAEAPANGQFDFEFRLFDALAGGTQVGATLVSSNTVVEEGLFTVELDFGPGIFSDRALWLGMGVRSSGTPTRFVSLPVRQALTAVPQAQYALVAGEVLDGAITAGAIAPGAVTTDKIQDGAVTAEKIASGQVVKSINGLKDAVVMEAGTNVTITTANNRIQVSATLNPTNVMAILQSRDGIGSGIDADFFDGKDSGLYALKSDVDDRLRKGGDTMTGTLTLQPPPTAQALIVTGNRRGTWNDSVAYFSNRQNASNVSPAVRIENTTGNSPDGVVSVSNNGLGYIARFGNSSKYVASLAAAGTLELTPNTGATALKVEANRNSGHLLEVRNAGTGDLALFASATDPKLTIEADGTVFSRASIFAAKDLTVGGDAIVNGNISCNGVLAADVGNIRIVAGGTTVTVAVDGAVTIDTGADLNLTGANINLTSAVALNLNGNLNINGGLSIPKGTPGNVTISAPGALVIKSTVTQVDAKESVTMEAAGSKVVVEGSGVTLTGSTVTLEAPILDIGLPKP